MMPHYTLSLISSLCFGTLAAYLAYRRGRNIYGWFLLGALLGLFGMMAIFFVSQNKKRARKKPVMVSTIAGPKDKFWYYLDAKHQRIGPISLTALTTEWRKGNLSSSTFVWNEEMADWSPLEKLIKKERTFSTSSP
jgi:hypothetical protein